MEQETQELTIKSERGPTVALYLESRHSATLARSDSQLIRFRKRQGAQKGLV